MAAIKKVVIALHEGENVTNKIWRFDSNASDGYTKEETVKALLPASNTLHVNVSKFIKKEGEGLKFDHEKVQELSGFNPFHSDVDFASIIPPHISTSYFTF